MNKPCRFSNISTIPNYLNGFIGEKCFPVIWCIATASEKTPEQCKVCTNYGNFSDKVNRGIIGANYID